MMVIKRVRAAAAEAADLLWSTSHEADTSSWFGWPTAEEWDSGVSTREQSSEQAHTGTFSAKCTSDTTDAKAAVRLAHSGHDLNVDEILPDTLYYSAWYYFPVHVDYVQGMNCKQWKRARQNPTGSDPVYNFVVANRAGGGEMFLRLFKHVGDDGSFGGAGIGFVADAPMDLPIGQWVHLETLYTWSAAGQGEIHSWQDGVELWHLTGIRTEFDAAEYLAVTSRPRQWSVNNYITGPDASAPLTDPAVTSVYIDDAALSNNRVWGLWP